jgi:hypothetical protein
MVTPERPKSGRPFHSPHCGWHCSSALSYVRSLSAQAVPYVRSLSAQAVSYVRSLSAQAVSYVKTEAHSRSACSAVSAALGIASSAGSNPPLLPVCRGMGGRQFLLCLFPLGGNGPRSACQGRRWGCVGGRPAKTGGCTKEAKEELTPPRHDKGPTSNQRPPGPINSLLLLLLLLGGPMHNTTRK